MFSPEFREKIVREAVALGLIDDADQTVVSIIDRDGLAANVLELHDAFPADLDVFHTFAVKANSIVPVLSEIKHLGMGAEAASHGELSRALEAGFDAHQIVFDSPAKGYSELRRALETGVALNVDNFQELARVAEIREHLTVPSRVGLRINPHIGIGSIAAMSTAGRHSKFGIPLQDPGAREEIISAYVEMPWLTRIHAHVGSQGCSLELIAEGIRAITDLADEINTRIGHPQLTTIDVGGGLSVDFENDTPVSRFREYVSALQDGAPRLFSGDYSIVTEFGRSILAKYGLTLARVEYTKTVGGHPIAITHAGAQVATRTVFMPEAWPLRLEAYSPQGASKMSEKPVVQDIAGPCCFAGDLVAQHRAMPRLDQGDILALLDTGAYYASTPFDYNSLPLPGVYGVTQQNGLLEFATLREPAESVVQPAPVSVFNRP